jgi:hypothetical protein
MRMDSWLQVRYMGHGVSSVGARRGVAKVIEFYLPKNFRRSIRWTAPGERGKILEFVLPVKKSA